MADFRRRRIAVTASREAREKRVADQRHPGDPRGPQLRGRSTTAIPDRTDRERAGQAQDADEEPVCCDRWLEGPAATDVSPAGAKVNQRRGSYCYVV